MVSFNRQGTNFFAGYIDEASALIKTTNGVIVFGDPQGLLSL
jgi:hypothetical protein